MTDDASKPVHGYPDYLIDETGVIVSKARPRTPGGIIKQRIQAGYATISVRLNERRKTLLVHRLMLLSFVGPSNGMEASHINGNRLDNRLCNLKWETHSENERRKLDHGTAIYGERTYNAKLTSADVISIRQLHGKMTQAELATMFGVCRSTVQRIQYHQRRILA